MITWGSTNENEGLEELRAFDRSNATNHAGHGVTNKSDSFEVHFIQQSDQVISKAFHRGILDRVIEILILHSSSKRPIKRNKTVILRKKQRKDFVPYPFHSHDSRQLKAPFQLLPCLFWDLRVKTTELQNLVWPLFIVAYMIISTSVILCKYLYI